MSNDLPIASLAANAVLVAALVAVLIYGFMTYLDPVFVFTYAASMRFCG